MGDRVKCPICRGCLRWLMFGPHRYIYCHFCNKYFRLTPGPEFVETTMEKISKLFREEQLP